MKKITLPVLCLAIILSLFSCGEAAQGGEATLAEGTDEAENSVVMEVRSSEKTAHPFLHFAYDQTWDEDTFVCGDGAPIEEELGEWSEATALPELVYGEDFAVTYMDKVTFRTVLVYDASMKPLGELESVEQLASLAPGKYLIGIAVDQEGAYIEAAQEAEMTGWVCLFRLIKE